MTARKELESIVLLSYLKKEMLDKIEDITQVVRFKAGETIFREGEFAEYLYALIDGTVTLELDKNSAKTIRIKNIMPRRTFGISSMVDTEQKTCISHARALTDCKAFRWNAAELEKLFYQDYEFGFLFMKRIAKILKTRLQTIEAQMVDAY